MRFGRTLSTWLWLVFIILTINSTPAFSAAELSKLNPKQNTDPRFKKGDEAFRKRASAEQARFALRHFREAFAKTPQDPEAAWRLSMACYFVGIRLTSNDDEKAKLYAEGRDAGKAGVEADPKCAACQFWTAINMALYGQTVGIIKMLFSLPAVRKHLNASIAIDPGYAYAGAHRLNGLIYQKLPGVLGGSNSKAREYYEMAIEAGPDEPLNYLFMAKLLEEEFDDRKAAVEYAKRGLAVPTPSADRLEALDALRDLKRFIASHPLPE